MSTFHSYPPIHHHDSRPISPSTALSLLSTFITNAATDPSLQPNALLTESGPVSSTSGSSTGLTIHNLKRVEAGLKGEHLGADLSFAKFGGEGLPDLQFGIDGPEGQGANKSGNEAVGQGVEGGLGEDGWQDVQAYEREQEMTEGEIGERNTGVEDGGEVPRVKESRSVHNKEERKRKKAEKRKQERRESHIKKVREKAAEI
ncbi:MAG: hypothetical protein M1830_007050 [Pleopsidium flavum]|nr:MAG: hypothetical protein M1830_007050 [Pleopsidium flavum]